MKLKTLKDIWEEHITENPDSKRALEYETRLKIEAIKWYHRSDDNKHKFIREFFNIDEKDLHQIKGVKKE